MIMRASLHTLSSCCFAFLLLVGAASAQQIPSNPQPWPGPPGSYQGPIRFVVFTVFGNWQHSTGACVVDGAIVSLTNSIPVGGQAPYGEMILLRSHPNYNEMVAALLTAKASGSSVDIQVIKDPNSNLPYYIPGGACIQMPVIGAVGAI